MKKVFFIVLCIVSLCYSCSNQTPIDNVADKKQTKLINTEIIYPSFSRSEVSRGDFKEGYMCTSDSSSLRLEVYPSNNNMETYSYIVDKEGNVSYLLKFKIDSFVSDGVCKFTTYNEFDEPIMSGVYDTVGSHIKITNVYGNDAVSRASAAAWGCGMAMGIAGGIWSTAVGMVSAGVGFVVGLSYTAAAIAICDGL